MIEEANVSKTVQTSLTSLQRLEYRVAELEGHVRHAIERLEGGDSAMEVSFQLRKAL